MGCVERGKRRSVLCRGQSTGVAVGEYAAIGSDQSFTMPADRPTHRGVFVADTPGFIQKGDFQRANIGGFG